MKTASTGKGKFRWPEHQPIRRQISDILGVLIPEGQWDVVFHELEKQGKLSQRKILDILLVILKRLDRVESDSSIKTW